MHEVSIALYSTTVFPIAKYPWCAWSIKMQKEKRAHLRCKKAGCIIQCVWLWRAGFFFDRCPSNGMVAKKMGPLFPNTCSSYYTTHPSHKWLTSPNLFVVVDQHSRDFMTLEACLCFLLSPFGWKWERFHHSLLFFFIPKNPIEINNGPRNPYL